MVTPEQLGGGVAEWISVALADIGVATVVTDCRGGILFMSPVAEALTGWPQNEAIGQSLATVYRLKGETISPAEENPVTRVLATGVAVELTDQVVLIARDGRELRLEQGAAPIRDAGTIIAAVLIFCEVSPRQRATLEAMALSEVRYRRLFETAQDGILLVDSKTRRVFDANPFLTDLLGYTRDELVGKELWEIGLFRDIEASKAAFRTLQENGYIRYEDLPLRTRDGRGIEVEFVSNVYDVGDAHVIQCNVRDVTDRKKVEETVRSAHAQLEERVNERTAELARSNAALTAEIARREQAEAGRRDLQRRLTTAQEDERRRIARELHDQLGQHLSGLGLGLKVVKDATPNPSPAWDRLHELQTLTDRIGRELHQLALELRPTALDDFGLEAALANYTEEWGARAGVEVDFHAAGLDDRRLPPATETALYRVILEALTNVRKHARATRVSVVLQAALRQVVAIVEDNGCGFDPEPALAGSPAEHRLGILGMRERVALLGGELTIDSEPGRGTTVIAHVPLAPTTEEARDG